MLGCSKETDGDKQLGWAILGILVLLQYQVNTWLRISDTNINTDTFNLKCDDQITCDFAFRLLIMIMTNDRR